MYMTKHHDNKPQNDSTRVDTTKLSKVIYLKY